jgi:hypothetical protein
VIYHITSRVNEQVKICLDVDDKQQFLERLASCIEKLEVYFYAQTLHLLLIAH